MNGNARCHHIFESTNASNVQKIKKKRDTRKICTRRRKTSYVLIAKEIEYQNQWCRLKTFCFFLGGGGVARPPTVSAQPIEIIVYVRKHLVRRSYCRDEVRVFERNNGMIRLRYFYSYFRYVINNIDCKEKRVMRLWGVSVENRWCTSDVRLKDCSDDRVQSWPISDLTEFGISVKNWIPVISIEFKYINFGHTSNSGISAEIVS